MVEEAWERRPYGSRSVELILSVLSANVPNEADAAYRYDVVAFVMVTESIRVSPSDVCPDTESDEAAIAVPEILPPVIEGLLIVVLERLSILLDCAATI